MGPKLNKVVVSSTNFRSLTNFDIDAPEESPRAVSLMLILKGKCVLPIDYFIFLAIFDGSVIFDCKWEDGLVLETNSLSVNLLDPYNESMLIDTPLVLILRGVTSAGKPSKDTDPLAHVDNRAGANVDMSQLLFGQKEVWVKAPLMLLQSGDFSGCKVTVCATASTKYEVHSVPLVMTMLSVHCLPNTKEGTCYVAAIGMEGLLEPMAVNFGMSLSSAHATKLLWATVASGGMLGNTGYNVPEEDRFVPENVEESNTNHCNSSYWNAVKRVLIDSSLFKGRLESQFLLEIAGVPRQGKVEARGRYMGYVDAAALLEPAQLGVTVCVKLKNFTDAELPPGFKPLLELPPTSAKASAREPDILQDEFGHIPYALIRFDLADPLVPKEKIAQLFQIIGFPFPEEMQNNFDNLYVEPPPEDPSVDVKRIKKEGGALQVHKELGVLACRGTVPMQQSIKRTAANRLLTQVRTMLRQFSPGECSYLEWQDTVTAQHAAARRAVTASFAPLAPTKRVGARVAASRCRIYGDNFLADKHIARNLKANNTLPRVLLAKALRCLEARDDKGALCNIIAGLHGQPRNRYLLWAYAGIQYLNGPDNMELAKVALRISVKGGYSDGVANSIGWGALHTLCHIDNNPYAAFVAAKRMRKSFELVIDWGEWKKFIDRWVSASGEEEVFWNPTTISIHDPLLLASTFFLCLRCYHFSDRILQCFEAGCGSRGSYKKPDPGESTHCIDIYYLRAASWLLRQRINEALESTQTGIKQLGPSGLMSQMLTTCYACANGWDDRCEALFMEAERGGAGPNPMLLLQAAISGMAVNPAVALQRAARAHQIAPGGHSALAIGRIYNKLDEHELAVRWAASAVKFEPLMADGWGFLAILALQERDTTRARTMLRSAKQAGPLSEDIEKELQALKKIVPIDHLADMLVKDLCLCELYD